MLLDEFSLLQMAKYWTNILAIWSHWCHSYCPIRFLVTRVTPMRPKKTSFIFQNGALNKAVNVKACTQDVFLFGKFSLCRVLCDIFQHVFFSHTFKCQRHLTKVGMKNNIFCFTKYLFHFLKVPNSPNQNSLNYN